MLNTCFPSEFNGARRALKPFGSKLKWKRGLNVNLKKPCFSCTTALYKNNILYSHFGNVFVRTSHFISLFSTVTTR